MELDGTELDGTELDDIELDGTAGLSLKSFALSAPRLALLITVTGTKGETLT